MLREDELHWHGGMKARLAYLLLQEMTRVTNNFPNIKLPLFIQHGEKDGIVVPKGSQSLYDSVSSTDKELKFYKDAYHHLFIELEATRNEAISDVFNWIEKRM